MGIQALNYTPSFGAGTSAVASNPGISGSDISGARKLNNASFYWDSLKKAVEEYSGQAIDGTRAVAFQTAGNQIINYSFLGGTLLEKGLNYLSPQTREAIKGFDKNLLASKTVRDGIERLSGCKFATSKETDKLVLNAFDEAAEGAIKTKLGRLAADVAGTTTRLGLGVSCLAEAPDLYHAYENGDLGTQAAKSACNIGASTLAFGIVSSLAKTHAPAKFKTLAMVGGAFAGSILASKATNAATDTLLGKTIQQQKEEIEQ